MKIQISGEQDSFDSDALNYRHEHAANQTVSSFSRDIDKDSQVN